MGKTLIITEKPSVGRDIARVLKCSGRGEGYLFSNTHVISWAIGHLAELAEPDDYNEAYKKWRMADLPIIPSPLQIRASARTKDQFNLLKKLMNDAETERIICATDSGREGELIFRYIYTLAGCVKPFDRLWISSMTDEAICAGFANLRPGVEYDNLYQSAKCRSEADWLVGINASRAYTLRYNALLSVGRVQTPTLALIVARQKEIDSFVPEEYYEITAALNALDIDFTAKYFDPANNNETKIKAAEQAAAVMKSLTPKPASAMLKSAESEEKQKPPPLLYDLTELQRDANRKFGYSAQKTLDIAQSLYEKRKAITYPRTDSRYLSKDIEPKFPRVLKKLCSYEPLKPYAEQLLALPDGLTVTKRIVDDTKVTDHHAIIPTDTGLLNVSAFTAEEANIFDLVARRFVSVFYPNYIYNSNTLVFDIANHGFIAKGTTVVRLGWMELATDSTDDTDKADKADKSDNATLPNLTAGDSADVKKIAKQPKKTRPPSPYTESTLLSAMEHAGRFVEDEVIKESLKDSGLGTPATRASIIERLIKVGYVRRKGKSLVPEEKGVLLVSVVPPEMKSAETTGKWEKGLVSVAGGEMTAERFMGSICKYVHHIVNCARTASSGVKFPVDENRFKKKSAAKVVKEKK
ncbi:MAG: DNA topoisomerase 3 [Defluviitaleaceae bacterium]|nr:DNA topoisomerase 3 [Defluviitaleaceae bacterium]